MNRSTQHANTLARRAGPWLLVLLVLGDGCASSHSGVERRGPLYAITAPTAAELSSIDAVGVTNTQPRVLQRYNGVEFRRATIAGRECLLFVSGMSLVNAAMTTQLALDRFPVTHMLMLGAAGGVNPSREPGDVVVPARWSFHSEAAYLNAGPDGSGWVFPPGFAPRYPNFGMIFPEVVLATRAGGSAPQPVDAFPADPGLLAAAAKVSTDRGQEILAGRWPKMVLGGAAVSGPAYVDNREYRAWLFRVWQAEVVDMESAAVAQVCWANHVPFAAVRVVSDLAGGGSRAAPNARPSEPVLPKAAATVLEMLRQLPP